MLIILIKSLISLRSVNTSLRLLSDYALVKPFGKDRVIAGVTGLFHINTCQL